MNDQNQQTHAETKLALLSAWVEYRDRVNELERENAALRAALEEALAESDDTVRFHIIRNAVEALRKEAQP